MGIREIAKKTNMSIATISRVLNHPELVKPSTRDKVLQVIYETNYKKYNSNMGLLSNIEEIGVVIPNVRDSFFSTILEGITKKSQDLGLTINLYLTQNDIKNETYAINQLLQKRIKGVIFIRARNQEAISGKNIEKLKQHHIPVVLIDRDISAKDYSGIFLSNANATYDAINLLIKKNYKKICIITGPKNNLNSDQRLEGYKKALSSNNITINANMIYQSGFTQSSGLKVTEEILKQQELPEIIFSCNNQITIGCIMAIKQNNLTNKDIKLFSFNKISDDCINAFDIAYIDHPLEFMGERSVTILKNKLVGTKGEIREVLDYKIVY